MFGQQSNLFKSLNKLTKLNVSASKSLLEQQVSFFSSALEDTVSHAGKLSKTNNLKELLASQKEFTNQLTAKANDNIKQSAKVITENQKQILAIFQDEYKEANVTKDVTKQAEAVPKTTAKKATATKPLVKKSTAKKTAKTAEVKETKVTATVKKAVAKVAIKAPATKTAVKKTAKSVTKPLVKPAVKTATKKTVASTPAKVAAPIVKAAAKPVVKAAEKVEQAKPVAKTQTVQSKDTSVK